MWSLSKQEHAAAGPIERKIVSIAGGSRAVIEENIVRHGKHVTLTTCLNNDTIEV